MMSEKEIDGITYSTELVDADELEPGDIIIDDRTDTVQMVRSVEVSDQDLGECSDPECCWQGSYLDIYFFGDGGLWCSQTSPQEKVISLIDF